MAVDPELKTLLDDYNRRQTIMHLAQNVERTAGRLARGSVSEVKENLAALRRAYGDLLRAAGGDDA